LVGKAARLKYVAVKKTWGGHTCQYPDNDQYHDQFDQGEAVCIASEIQNLPGILFNPVDLGNGQAHVHSFKAGSTLTLDLLKPDNEIKKTGGHRPPVRLLRKHGLSALHD
jgi:hypothetical protein